MFSVMTVFIVAVTDASAEEDLSSGKNNSFCRLISAGISTFYPRQSCLQAKSWNGNRNPSDIPVHLCVALDLTLSCAVEIDKKKKNTHRILRTSCTSYFKACEAVALDSRAAQTQFNLCQTFF